MLLLDVLLVAPKVSRLAGSPSNFEQARLRNIFATIGDTLAHDTNDIRPQLFLNDICRTSHGENQLTGSSHLARPEDRRSDKGSTLVLESRADGARSIRVDSRSVDEDLALQCI